MKIFFYLLAISTLVNAHGGHWSQGGSGAAHGYPKQHSYGAGAWNGKAYGGGGHSSGSAGLYGGGGGHKVAHSPPIISHVSRNGDSTSFSIGQQGLVKPIAPAPTAGLYGHSSGGLYGHSGGGSHHGGLYGGSHGKSQYGGLYGYGADSVPESSFDYTVKHPNTYGSNNGWGSQSGGATYLGASSYGRDTVPGTSYEHTASGSPGGWNGAGGSHKSKSAGWWSKRN